MNQIIDANESAVRTYSRNIPVTFVAAKGSYLQDEQGRKYLDFLAGAGSLNYGHNHPVLKQALLDYIAGDGIAHSLDFYTEAKQQFIEAFRRQVLLPRGFDYRLQFTGPTGANAVEAAMKLARKVTGRTNIIAFTNGFHGVTQGALAATGNQHHRNGAGVSLNNVTRMPYAGYFGDDVDTIAMLAKQLADPSSGIDKPAAFIVETIQGEGGLNVASFKWLRRLDALAKKHGILLIVDDIQAGCGRSGTYFSFEPAKIVPDIVTLSKSLSGFGLPCAVVLLKPQHDIWKPGEHNGTFRGNNHAFVTAAAALNHFWADDRFENEVRHKAVITRQRLYEIAAVVDGARVKGRGLMQGIEFPQKGMAAQICKLALKQGLVIETSGPNDEVVKCLCPLTISEDDLLLGLDILAASVAVVAGEKLAVAS